MHSVTKMLCLYLHPGKNLSNIDTIGFRIRYETRDGLFESGIHPNLTNPGDEAHTLPDIYKIVPGMGKQTLDKLYDLYGGVVPHVCQSPETWGR